MNITQLNVNSDTALTEKPRIQTAARTCSLLIAVANAGVQGISAKKLSEQLKIPRQVVYHLIHTLVSIGMLRKATAGSYTLGLSVGPIAHAFRQQLSSSDFLYDYAREAARLTGETAYVSGWLDGEIVVFASQRGSAAITASVVPEGKVGDGHSRASGKLLLAMSTTAEVDEYIRANPIRPLTPNTVKSRQELDSAMETIRQDMIAYDREEYAPDLSCIAVPLGGIPARFALSISIPTQRLLERADWYAATLRDIATKFSSVLPD